MVTVKSPYAGTRENVIPDTADFSVNIRTMTPTVRRHLATHPGGRPTGSWPHTSRERRRPMSHPEALPHEPYSAYQEKIYRDGLFGITPQLPMDFAELEERARHAMSPSTWSYVAGGAGDEHTQNANRAAFSQWGLVPRMLVGAKHRDLSVDLFGLTLPSPLFLAPGGVRGSCTPD